MPAARTLALALAAVASLPPAPPFSLDDEAVPARYRVELTIDPARDSFDGRIHIEIQLHKAVRVLWLNAADLSVSRARIEAHGRVHAARPIAAPGELLALELPVPVGPGPATVSLEYRALLPEKASIGPFRLNYGGAWYAFTTFTPTGARRAFPCFDHPRFKAPWEIAIRTGAGQRAFSNAPALREKATGSGTLVEFAPTPPLASEVIAFAVGPLETTDGGIAGARGIPVRVVAPRGYASQATEALEATSAILARLEEYTGIPYPWAKLDHLAVPEAPFTATENPGLIDYRMRELLAPVGLDAAGRRRAVRSVLSHELAHQWFGNLVTQRSWDDVWLSEGFATWLSDKLMDEEQPKARKHLAAALGRARAMAAEGRPDVRPVRLAMEDAAAVKRVYTLPVYLKGAAVLEMLESWIGEVRFRDILRVYLKEHSGGTVTTADLAAALRVAEPGASPVLQDFLDQSGIPSIRFEVNCTGPRPRLAFEQTNPAGHWSVPVCWTSDGGSRACALLDTPRREVELRQETCPVWFNPNADATGYYRTEWTPAQLDQLARGGLARMNAAERLALLDDLAALRRSGRLDLLAVQPLLEILAFDREPEVARAAREQM